MDLTEQLDNLRSIYLRAKELKKFAQDAYIVAIGAQVQHDNEQIEAAHDEIIAAYDQAPIRTARHNLKMAETVVRSCMSTVGLSTEEQNINTKDCETAIKNAYSKLARARVVLNVRDAEERFYEGYKYVRLHLDWDLVILLLGDQLYVARINVKDTTPTPAYLTLCDKADIPYTDVEELYCYDDIYVMTLSDHHSFKRAVRVAKEIILDIRPDNIWRV